MRIALLQINPTPGALEANSELIVSRASRAARSHDIDLAITPELALMGYLPRDLLMQQAFVERSHEYAERIAKQLAAGPPLLVGVATPNTGGGRPLFNSALLLHNGRIAGEFHKSLLPTYDVFDEDRYFEPAQEAQVLRIGEHRLGISVCEDVWNDAEFWPQRRYQHDPISILAGTRIDAVVNLSASPFTVGKQVTRERMLAHIAARHKLPVVYVNQVGGNDELVFDGGSCAFDCNGRLLARAAAFEEETIIVDLQTGAGTVAQSIAEPEEEIWRALVLGTRDYVRKTGFSKVLLGLSGGIDSALTATIAVDAVGSENTLGVLMPSPYSSAASVDDSLALAQNLGIRTFVLPISPIMESFAQVLHPAFARYGPDVTEENIQARIRGNLLMALSNKLGALVLSTGNKSELSVGYCTVYGDMCGGLAVISDLAKTMVYRVARWRNRRKADIPDAILKKEPSAELRPGQKDQDSLPPYEILDAILERHIENSLSAEEIIYQGYAPETVRQVVCMVTKAEFKRKQAAPGLKITPRAFGTGWRMPISRGAAI